MPGRVLSVAAHIDTPIEKDAEALVHRKPPARRSAAERSRSMAPISGFVSAVKVVPGQPVEPADSLVEIIDLSEVHAIAAVPEHLAGHSSSTRRAHPRRRRILAAISRRSSNTSARKPMRKAGTIEARFHVENPELLLRPEMRAEFSIVLSKREGVMSVPREAVQGDAGRRFVYVADFELKNAFVKTPVVLGAQNDRFVEVNGRAAAGR